jgi:hypothetical protein
MGDFARRSEPKKSQFSDRLLAATNADEIKQLRRGQTLSSIPRRRQKGWDNYENRGLREGETDDCLRLGRAIQS